MSRWIASLLAVVLLLPGAGIARAQNVGDYRELLTQQQRFLGAKDGRAAVSFCAPGFTYTTHKGRVLTGKQALEEIRAHADSKPGDTERMLKQLAAEEGMRVGKLTETAGMDSVSVHKDEAIVLVSGTASLPFTDPDGSLGPVGKEHDLTLSIHMRYAWTRSGRSWKLQAITVSGDTPLIDGKPAPDDDDKQAAGNAAGLPEAAEAAASPTKPAP